MTDTSSSPGVGARIPAQSPAQSSGSMGDATGWVGWIVFGAVMMITLGVLHAIQGFVALFKQTYYVVTDRGLLITVDYTAWGWVHLIVGLLVAAAGAALLSGRMWARIVGVGVVLLSMLANFAFIAAYPLWSISLIAVDILVVYALIVHGREMRAAS